MHGISTASLKFFTAIFIINLFGFKFNLIDFAGSGIRLEDILFVPVLIILGISLRRLRIRLELQDFLLFLAFSLASLAFGSLSNRISPIEGALYWFRNVQYLCFFFIGMAVSTRINLDRIFKAYVVYAFILVILQAAGILPTLSLFVGSGRAIANTGGPYELAVLASLLAFFFWFRRSDKIYFYTAVILLVLTQSRITLAAFLIIFFTSCLERGRGILFSLGVFSVVIALAFPNLAVIDRFREFFDISTVDYLESLLTNPKSFATTWEYRDWAFINFREELLSTEGDISSFIRLTRWAALLRSTSECGFECILFGLGPSFGSSAVDGNFTRLFIEYGIIGTVLFLYGIWRVVKSVKSPLVSAYFLILLISACAIDIFVASKPMSIFWFLCGVYLKRQRLMSNDAIGTRQLENGVQVRPPRARRRWTV